MSNKILVTGASGFIGGALVAYLRRKSKSGSCVICADRRQPAIFDKNSFLLDLLKKEKVIRFLQRHRPTLIFHCAGGRFRDPRLNFETNVLTTYNLLEAVSVIPKYSPRLVVIGSAAEYGIGQGRVLTEKFFGVPSGEYGWAKLVQTYTALYYARTGVDVVVGRIFNTLGPGLPVVMGPGRFACQIVLREKGFKHGDIVTASLSTIRDFVDMRDVCSALYALAVKGRRGEVYNICSQRRVVMRELLRQMIRCSFDKGMKFREAESSPSDIFCSVGSNAKICRETGWHPRYKLQDSLKATLDFYRTLDKAKLCASS